MPFVYCPNLLISGLWDWTCFCRPARFLFRLLLVEGIEASYCQPLPMVTRSSRSSNFRLLLQKVNRFQLLRIADAQRDVL